MTFELLFVSLLLFIGFIGLYFALRQQLTQLAGSQKLEDTVNKIFGMSANVLSAQSKSALAGERELIASDLNNKQATIEKLVKDLQREMEKRQVEIRELERDRVQTFSAVTKSLDQHQKLTEDLRVSTQQLASVLSNNQARGEWGERIIEDLLTANGLVENVHYSRQMVLGGSTLRPDITLLLPNKRVVAVDVKFPYQEIQKLQASEGKEAQQQHLKQFERDLRTKITKVAEYISPENETLDYAIMFVPNEMVFSFINQHMPGIVDAALAQRVILVSPFTFLIVARTVIESYRNFMIGDKLKQIVQQVDEFVGEWTRFKEEFDKFGRSIDTLKTGYERITETRTKQMEKRIAKIETYRQGQLVEKKVKVLAEEVE